MAPDPVALTIGAFLDKESDPSTGWLMTLPQLARRYGANVHTVYARMYRDGILRSGDLAARMRDIRGGRLEESRLARAELPHVYLDHVTDPLDELAREVELLECEASREELERQAFRALSGRTCDHVTARGLPALTRTKRAPATAHGPRRDVRVTVAARLVADDGFTVPEAVRVTGAKQGSLIGRLNNAGVRTRQRGRPGRKRDPRITEAARLVTEEGLTYREAAERTGVPQGSIATRVWKDRRASQAA